jgi:hypothetical protein
MHQPWRHRSGLDPYTGVIPRMPAEWGTDPAKVCGRHCRRRKWPSSSTKRPIQQNGSSINLRQCESPGDTAGIAALSADHAPTAIIGCPHMTMPTAVLIAVGAGIVWFRAHVPSARPRVARLGPDIVRHRAKKVPPSGQSTTQGAGFSFKRRAPTNVVVFQQREISAAANLR